jgi:hypothetical protein
VRDQFWPNGANEDIPLGWVGIPPEGDFSRYSINTYSNCLPRKVISRQSFLLSGTADP